MRRTRVSAPETQARAEPTRGVRLASCHVDLIELSAYVAPAANARRRVAGLELPAFGRVTRAAQQVVLSVRPGRWLVLSSPLAPGVAAEQWALACANQGSIVELSSALAVFALGGARAAEVLTRGCRLDLDAEVFQTGRAAATIMAQVSVILAAVPAGLLLLTPSSTARHVREWLTATARPFGVAGEAELPFSDICGDRSL
jgi:sarcosine oxidase subunit gamma